MDTIAEQATAQRKTREELARGTSPAGSDGLIRRADGGAQSCLSRGVRFPSALVLACRRVDRAVALGAAVAIGSSIAGCGDADQGPKVPMLAATTSVLDTERGPSAHRDPLELDLDAEEGRLRTFETSPGFTPDPLTIVGTASGGPIDAHDLDDRCAGWLATEPDVVFTAERPFAELAVMAASSSDTTLFVRDPGGEVRCGDDEEGEHPIVRGLFARGTYRVWVGTEERDASAPYVLALTELDDSRPSRLLH